MYFFNYIQLTVSETFSVCENWLSGLRQLFGCADHSYTCVPINSGCTLYDYHQCTVQSNQIQATTKIS